MFEGFGLPVLEAMAKGTPVLCSNSSSIPEVGGNAVLTFDPYSKEEIKKQLLTVLNSKGLRNNMINKGLYRATKFTKEYAAKRTLDILRQFE